MTGRLPRAWLGLAALFVTAYLVFLVVTLPASLLATLLERVGGDGLALRQAGGTIWHGQGVLAIGGTPGRELAPIRWRLQPLQLLSGELRFAFSSDAPDARLQGAAGLRWGGLVLEGVSADLAADVASALYRPAAAAGLDGRLRFDVARLELAPQHVQGEASAVWERAGARAWQAREVGDYRLDLKGSGQQADVKLVTLRGALRVTADGVWSAKGGRGVLDLRGTAEVAAGRQDLNPVLMLLGIPPRGGRREFSVSVPLELWPAR
jgi:hypothetical protein